MVSEQGTVRSEQGTAGSAHESAPSFVCHPEESVVADDDKDLQLLFGKKVESIKLRLANH